MISNKVSSTVFIVFTEWTIGTDTGTYAFYAISLMENYCHDI